MIHLELDVLEEEHEDSLDEKSRQSKEKLSSHFF